VALVFLDAAKYRIRFFIGPIFSGVSAYLAKNRLILSGAGSISSFAILGGLGPHSQLFLVIFFALTFFYFSGG
jgi:hypothetical protein